MSSDQYRWVLLYYTSDDEQYYCVVDIVPYTDSNDVFWNKDNRIVPNSSSMRRSRLKSIFLSGKDRLSKATYLTRAEFEFRFGKVDYLD